VITTVLLAALVAAVALLSLVLVEVVRRLREHELALDRLSGRAPDPGAYAGQKINPADLGDEDAFTGVVGFFSTTCMGCLTVAPQFAQWSSTNQGRAAPAVIVGSGGHGDELRRKLLGSTRLIDMPESARLTNALSVDEFPLFLEVDEGLIVSGSNVPPVS